MTQAQWPIGANRRGHTPVLAFNDLVQDPQSYLQWAKRGAVYAISCEAGPGALLLPGGVAEEIARVTGAYSRVVQTAPSATLIEGAVRIAALSNKITFFLNDAGKPEWAISPSYLRKSAMTPRFNPKLRKS